MVTIPHLQDNYENYMNQSLLINPLNQSLSLLRLHRSIRWESKRVKMPWGFKSRDFYFHQQQQWGRSAWSWKLSSFQEPARSLLITDFHVSTSPDINNSRENKRQAITLSQHNGHGKQWLVINKKNISYINMGIEVLPYLFLSREGSIIFNDWIGLNFWSWSYWSLSALLILQKSTMLWDACIGKVYT